MGCWGWKLRMRNYNRIIKRDSIRFLLREGQTDAVGLGSKVVGSIHESGGPVGGVHHEEVGGLDVVLGEELLLRLDAGDPVFGGVAHALRVEELAHQVHGVDVLDVDRAFFPHQVLSQNATLVTCSLKSRMLSER